MGTPADAPRPPAALRRPGRRRAPASPCSSTSRTARRCRPRSCSCEDRLPPALGRPARLVVTGVPGRSVAARLLHGAAADPRPVPPGPAHGRRLRPLRADAAPARVRRARRAARHAGDRGPRRRRRTPAIGPSFGATRARQLFRTGEEYYTMRQYQRGRRPPPDPLAVGRAHRRSDDPPGRVVPARERARVPRQPGGSARPDPRAGVRARRLGGRHARRPARPARVQRCSSATTETPPATVTEDRFLDALSGISHAAGPLDRPDARPPAGRQLGRHLARVRLGAARARGAHVADPQRCRLRAQARRPRLPRRPRHPAARATGPARGPRHPGADGPRPRRMGLHRAAHLR